MNDCTEKLAINWSVPGTLGKYTVVAARCAGSTGCQTSSCRSLPTKARKSVALRSTTVLSASDTASRRTVARQFHK